MSDQKHRPNATVTERICEIFSQKASQEAASINATAQSEQGVHVTFSARVRYVGKSPKIAWDIRVLPLLKPAKIKGVVQDEDPDQVVMGNILAEAIPALEAPVSRNLSRSPGICEPPAKAVSEYGEAPEPLSVQRAKRPVPAKTSLVRRGRSTKK